MHGLNDGLRQNIIECVENMYLMESMEDMETKFRTYLLSDKQSAILQVRVYNIYNKE